NEDEYIESIDASFPYHDENEWKAVIKEGVGISDEAAYYALYEICRSHSEYIYTKVRSAENVEILVIHI
ncbi:MAG: hypothetical protein WC476_10480, partial [Phycisphaerae bacterium]